VALGFSRKSEDLLLWLPASAGSLFAQIDAKPFRHPVERAAIDPERFRRARAIAADGLQHVEQVAAFQLVERRQSLGLVSHVPGGAGVFDSLVLRFMRRRPRRVRI